MHTFRHIVMFKWSVSASPDSIDDAERAIRRFGESVSDFCELWSGRNVGNRTTNYDYVVIADFADVTAYETFASHPEHLVLIDRHLRPLLESRSAVQIPIYVDLENPSDG